MANHYNLVKLAQNQVVGTMMVIVVKRMEVYIKFVWMLLKNLVIFLHKLVKVVTVHQSNTSASEPHQTTLFPPLIAQPQQTDPPMQS